MRLANFVVNWQRWITKLELNAAYNQCYECIPVLNNNNNNRHTPTPNMQIIRRFQVLRAERRRGYSRPYTSSHWLYGSMLAAYKECRSIISLKSDKNRPKVTWPFDTWAERDHLNPSVKCRMGSNVTLNLHLHTNCCELPRNFSSGWCYYFYSKVSGIRR